MRIKSFIHSASTCVKECFSGTLFLKLWRRKTSILAYKWAVDEFALTEPDRPQFYGTKKRKVRRVLFTTFCILKTICIEIKIKKVT